MSRLQVALVVAGCGAVPMALNVWPRLAKIIKAGSATNGDIAFLVVAIAFALGMAAVPFAVDKAKTRGRKYLYWALGISLGCINYALGNETVGTVFEAGPSANTTKINKAAIIAGQLKRAQDTRASLPKVAPAVNQEMLDAANQAVRLAEEARKQECGKVGDNCRARVKELAAATEARAPLLEKKAITDQIAKAEADIAKAESDKINLGDIPQEVDSTTARLAKQIGHFIDLGPTPVTTTRDILVSAIVIVAEAFGLLGPNLFITAMSKDTQEPAPKPRRWQRLTSLWRRQEAEPATPSAPEPAETPQRAPVQAPEPPRLPANVTPLRQTPPKDVGGPEEDIDPTNVILFLTERMIRESGEELDYVEIWPRWEAWALGQTPPKDPLDPRRLAIVLNWITRESKIPVRRKGLRRVIKDRKLRE